MPKTKLSSRIKIAFLRIMEALGTTASPLGQQRQTACAGDQYGIAPPRDIDRVPGLRAFELWHNGVKLPKELSDMFTELSEIDDKLSILRAQKYAKVKVEGEEPDTDVEAALPVEEAPAEPEAEAGTSRRNAGNRQSLQRKGRPPKKAQKRHHRVKIKKTAPIRQTAGENTAERIKKLPLLDSEGLSRRIRAVALLFFSDTMNRKWVIFFVLCLLPRTAGRRAGSCSRSTAA